MVKVNTIIVPKCILTTSEIFLDIIFGKKIDMLPCFLCVVIVHVDINI